ncbi:hypothetical protein NC653_008876 [Populus alba x Populus x berolinensis]|uniref:Autophagy-related protein 3 n=1 Tax=Populus alba x Populus x berolinensis TaxID=444605 RepID=A0AAD6WAT9_9ROSI|nr:hypothetical protein NC653_008876 [Populus alba x Populus x berolinensis]
MVLSQKIHEAFKGTVERITGPRTVSAFKEKGVLSVSEFILAGDNLVSKCPTWSWESGEPSKRKPYLPAEKQFLITRNVPCLRRAASVEEEYEAAGGEVLLDNEDNDGWLATHGKPKETKGDEDENVPSMEALDISVKRIPIQTNPSYFGGEEEEDIPDMADFEDPDNLIKSDPATLQTTYLVAHEPDDDDNILRTRTYDVSITYDKYYQTPRVWLTGYDESRMLLHPELVLEDVSQDHARKTVLRFFMLLTNQYCAHWMCCTHTQIVPFCFGSAISRPRNCYLAVMMWLNKILMVLRACLRLSVGACMT